MQTIQSDLVINCTPKKKVLFAVRRLSTAELALFPRGPRAMFLHINFWLHNHFHERKSEDRKFRADELYPKNAAKLCVYKYNSLVKN